MWYFNQTFGKCQNFWYDGCVNLKSQNIFETQNFCQNICELPSKLIKIFFYYEIVFTFFVFFKSFL